QFGDLGLLDVRGDGEFELAAATGAKGVVGDQLGGVRCQKIGPHPLALGRDEAAPDRQCGWPTAGGTCGTWGVERRADEVSVCAHPFDDAVRETHAELALEAHPQLRE